MNNLDVLKNQNAIAIIGLSCRFPGARGVQQFWQNLKDGAESISFFSDEELKESGIDPVLLNDSNYVKAGGVLEDIEWFDARFFRYSPREANLIDPQHRLFLECAWEAMEGAGYNPETYPGLIGVFAGASSSDYLLKNIYSNPNLVRSVDKLELETSNDVDYLATRVSYKLNLKGPSITVQTACSTSLVAVNMACESLSSGQADMAIAGAVSINLPQKKGYQYIDGGISSPDGHCHAFDAKAQGTVFGNGIGIVVLKRLADALKDGDHIYAVIIGYAINNDGAAKVGFTAPSVEGQANVIADALAMADIDAETISYVETHGTGTVLGDPIEIAALTQAFRVSTLKNGFCAIGSVKTNIGHMFMAAGIAGLIKTVMALKHKMIPPSLNFEEPNFKIDFVNSPFYVNSRLSEWKADNSPRRSGVSSFGVGGTNAHAVLEEAPAGQPSGRSRPWQLLLISAQSSSALEKATTNLVEHLKNNPDQNLSDVVYTLQVGRKAFNYRRMVVCKDYDDAMRSLETPHSGLVLSSYQEPVNREIVFMFSGQGAQYVNMGLELYQTESIFREEVDRCSEILKAHLSLDLRDILYPDKKNVMATAEKLKQTFITQPALFVIEYALAKLWMSWGVHPAAMVGHSIGEYVAACLAGVFSLEDALLLVATRGRLMQQQPTGSMLAVQLSEKDIERFLNQRLSLAAVNAPSYCVVSGETEAIKQLENVLGKNNVAFTPLHTSHAFHSKMMEPILNAFNEQIRQVKLSPPQITFVSNLTGTWITSEEAVTPSYWTKHLRQTVRFSNCLEELLKGSDRIFLEVGPGQTLSTFVRQHPDQSKGRVVLSSLRHPKEEKSDVTFILNSLGRLWLAGVEVDWPGFYKDERRHRIPLPTYPFERQQYWVEPQQLTQPTHGHQKAFTKKSDVSEWFYLPSWKRSLAPKKLNGKTLEDQKLCWLLFGDECGLSSKLIKRLEQQSQEVIAVQMGRKFGAVSKGIYTVNPQGKNDYIALIKELGILGKLPQKIVHLWSITENNSLPSGIESFHKFQELGFYSLILLTQALAKQHMTQSIELDVITNFLHEVTDEGELLCPEKATVLGACKVIPQEYPNITCRNIDLGVNRWPEKQIEQLLDELMVPPADSIVAYRGKHRWVQIFEQMKLNGLVETKPRLREGGVYLITGGLGGVGMVLAEVLAREVKAKLILTGRSEIPVRDQWPQWMASHSETEVLSRKMRQVKALEELGAEVLAVRGDVADENQMRAIIAQAEKQFGRINGVIHAAGIVIDAPLQEVSQNFCEQYFQSKVNGLFVLEKVLEGRAIDFCLLISSLSSVLGGIGFTGYAAANLFMDAFVHRHNRFHSVPWISINWDAWQLKEKIDQTLKKENELTELSIKPKEGQEVFKRILSWDLGNQIIISTGDLQARIDKWIKLESFHGPEQIEKVEVSNLHSRPTLSSEYVPPGNPTEQIIAEMWQHMLNIEKVGIHDNFFELGGNSLLAVRLFAQIEKIFKKRLPLATMIDSPTVEELARILTKEEWSGSWASLVKIQSGDSKPPFFCVHGAGGNVLIYNDLARYLGPDQPFYGIQAQGLDGEQPFITRIEDMAVHYLKEIQSVQPQGPYFLGGYCMGGTIALEMAKQLHAQGEKVALLALMETYNWANVPPLSLFKKCHFNLEKIGFHFQNFLILSFKEKVIFFREKAKELKKRSGIWFGIAESKFADENLKNHGQYLLLARLWENNDRAASNYAPKFYQGKITLFLPKKRYSIHDGPDITLDKFARNVETYELPIYPAGMLVKPFVEKLAQKLRVCIDQSLRNTHSQDMPLPR